MAGLNLLGRICAWRENQGYVRPARDLSLMHADLIDRGMARNFGAPLEPGVVMTPVDDVAQIALRVRRLFGSATDA